MPLTGGSNGRSGTKTAALLFSLWTSRWQSCSPLWTAPSPTAPRPLLAAQLHHHHLANEAEIDGDRDEFTITGNIVCFSSTKSKRVTRSVPGLEVYEMVAGVDMAYALSSTLNLIHRAPRPSAYSDSYLYSELALPLRVPRQAGYDEGERLMMRYHGIARVLREA